MEGRNPVSHSRFLVVLSLSPVTVLACAPTDGRPAVAHAADQRLPRPAPLPEGTLAIDGQFVTNDEGNRARRMVIGFGAGGSEVSAVVQVRLGTAAGPIPVQESRPGGRAARSPARR
jgi:hypothetical protein